MSKENKKRKRFSKGQIVAKIRFSGEAVIYTKEPKNYTIECRIFGIINPNYKYFITVPETDGL